MAELHVESAKEAARIALRFAQAGSFMKADWQNDQPWAHRSDLAHALEHIETLAAMVLNLADRVPCGVPVTHPTQESKA